MKLTKEHRQILHEYIDSYTVYADLNEISEVRQQAYLAMKSFEDKYPIYKGQLTLTKVESKGPGHVVIEVKTRKEPVYKAEHSRAIDPEWDWLRNNVDDCK